MAIGSGLGSQLGIAPETTYGTFVAPTSFLLPVKTSLKKNKNTAQSAGIASGRLMQLASGRVLTTRSAEGSIDLELTTRKMGLLLQALMGTTVTPTVLTSPAYSQVHTLADTADKSLSIQVGVPEIGGTVRPYSYAGCKVTSAQFEFEPGSIPTATFEFDCQDVTETPPLAAASFPTGITPFVGAKTAIKIGTFGSEAAVVGVKKATVKIDRALDTDRFYLGGAGLKAQPVSNGFVGISGTLSADFVAKADFVDRFVSDASFSLVLETVGALIGGTNYETFRITLPGCFLDGDLPALDGPGVVSGDFPFVALFDGTNQPKIEVISSESTLA
ncbi:phage tail tube protein [Cellulomonas uda]|uniref:Phage tail protein n=1 Tax=Cellulomonas uda TaxID=1714 RepID=A0A4Y3KAB9_CELUD|nr:phage tail tube protein [Cellulomonas uda]NII67818.1 hypothetical protein [Cellulomonas uda]GEA79935.1 hypothetical protein CUD01_03790 [Cellulomonas uda]